MAQASGIAIIGGGPAGLSAARLLSERGVRDVTVFEAQPRVGGKSLSVMYGGALHDLGTCYSTWAHARTNRWMRKLGFRQIPLGLQTVDGKPLMNFVGEGPGPSVPVEAWRYFGLWRAFMARLQEAPSNSDIVREAAEPVSVWLERHKLGRIRRFMLRAVTSIGYSPLEEISTLQALRWCTPSLIVSGALGQVKMPVDGWQPFWEQLVKGIDVRVDEPVLGIERDADGVTVTTRAGTQRFARVLITTAPDEIGRVMKTTDAERFVGDALRWNSYVISLVRAENWFSAHEAEAYADSLGPDAETGMLLSARRVRTGGPPSAMDIYLCGQYGNGRDSETLKAMLARGIAARGARMRYLIVQKNWKYFPRYDRQAIREGLLARMDEVQGQNRTWWAGAAFSHEAVSNVVAFNERLVPKITASLAA